MKKIALIAACLLTFIGGGQVSAGSPPSALPHAFYGSLLINGARRRPNRGRSQRCRYSVGCGRW
jgi:hypothetical protein